VLKIANRQQGTFTQNHRPHFLREHHHEAGQRRSANVYNDGIVIVENSDEDVQLTFYLTDAHEMSWVIEFLDVPFFARDETQRLFGLVNADRNVSGERVGRFHVDFHRWQPRHAEILVFSFTPIRGQGSHSPEKAGTTKYLFRTALNN
jgi:hypothetical protein